MPSSIFYFVYSQFLLQTRHFRLLFVGLLFVFLATLSQNSQAFAQAHSASTFNSSAGSTSAGFVPHMHGFSTQITSSTTQATTSSKQNTSSSNPNTAAPTTVHYHHLTGQQSGTSSHHNAQFTGLQPFQSTAPSSSLSNTPSLFGQHIISIPHSSIHTWSNPQTTPTSAGSNGLTRDRLASEHTNGFHHTNGFNWKDANSSAISGATKLLSGSNSSKSRSFSASGSVSLNLNSRLDTVVSNNSAPVQILSGGSLNSQGIVQGGTLITIAPGQLVTPAQAIAVDQVFFGQSCIYCCQ